jgi:hypothetical protein
LVVVVVVVVVVVEVVDGVLGVVEPHAPTTPIITAAATPTSAEVRRELCITNAIPTHTRCENGCFTDVEMRRDSCQLRGGTPLTPSVELE